MAGGTGTRFWPESRLKKPKQFLQLVGNQTMLQSTVSRISSMIKPQNILVVTNSGYMSLVQEQLPDLPKENIIGEITGKNTAPCVASATAIILERNPDASMVVLPSDHYIRDEKKFLKTIEAGFAKAENDHCLVTIGITPTRPETGYGYIQTDDKSKHTVSGSDVFKVKTFAEKPDLQTAVMFLESGDFLWNSGMFIWRAADIWKNFELHLPVVYSDAVKLKSELKTDPQSAIDTFYQDVDSISVDYGIMEKADTVFVLPGSFGWNDVGSWMAIYELEEKQKEGNVVRSGEALFENSQNCFVSSTSQKLITMVGLQGVGIVETDDAILVCRMDKAQDVRGIVKQLENPDYEKYR